MFQVEKSLFLENHNFIKCFYEKTFKRSFFEKTIFYLMAEGRVLDSFKRFSAPFRWFLSEKTGAKTAIFGYNQFLKLHLPFSGYRISV